MTAGTFLASTTHVRAVVLASVLSGCLLLGAGPARADERFVDQDERTRSYAGEIVGVTLAAQSLLWLGIGAESGVLAAVGALTQVLGPPMVHWAHGNGWQGALSLGIELTLPIVSTFVVTTVALSAEGGDGCGFGCTDTAMAGLIGGFLLGIITATTLESVLLAWDTEDRAPGPTPPSSSFRVWLAPSLVPGTVGLSAGAQM